MQQLVLTAVNTPLQLVEAPDLEPAAGEVLVRLYAAALNHRDIWISQGRYPSVHPPCVLGSDGAGTVVACGADVDASWQGRAAVINPAFAWGDDAAVQGADFTILGLPRPGTHATHIAVPVSQLGAKPPELDWRQAAALPLAGLTAWRALVVKGQPRPTDTVLITGIGGGVALFALQIAIACGWRCVVTSSSAGKRERALRLGAAAAYDYRDPEWGAALKAAGGFQVAIDGAGGPGFNHLVDAATPGARIVVYGGTAGLPEALNLRAVFFKQLQILGTTMGSPLDFAQWLRFVQDRRIQPVLDQDFSLADGQAAYARMASGAQCGKITLSC